MATAEEAMLKLRRQIRRRRFLWWGMFLIPVVAYVAIMVPLQEGDGYRPTDRTLNALELSKAGKKREAFPLYLEEAKKGDRYAQFAVGAMYDFGHGVQKDMDKAIPWYTKAANQDQLSAQYALALIYLDEPEFRNRELGLQWLHKAAELGDGRSQYALALDYLEGRNPEQDVEKGLMWLRTAANQGEPKALNKLGILHENGEVVEQDFDEALKFFKQAAEQGGVYGVTNTARLMEQSDSPLITRLDVYKWNYILEQLGGPALATRKRKQLEQNMPSWDISRARMRARFWLWLHGDAFE